MTRAEIIGDHVVVRVGTAPVRYAMARDTRALPIVGPLRSTKAAAWEAGIALLTGTRRTLKATRVRAHCDGCGRLITYPKTRVKTLCGVCAAMDAAGLPLLHDLTGKKP